MHVFEVCIYELFSYLGSAVQSRVEYKGAEFYHNSFIVAGTDLVYYNEYLSFLVLEFD